MASASNDFTAVAVGANTLSSFRLGGGNERQGHVSLSGNGVGTVQLERRPLGSSVWHPIYGGGVQLYVWNYAGQPLSEDFSEGEDGMEYRLNCTAWTSGTITGRLSN